MSRTRPDVPDLVRAHPHRTHPVVAGDGPLLVITYADEIDGTLRFLLVSAETAPSKACSKSCHASGRRDSVLRPAQPRRDDGRRRVFVVVDDATPDHGTYAFLAPSCTLHR